MWAAAAETNWHGKSFKALTDLRCTACPSASPPATQHGSDRAEPQGLSEQTRSPALAAQSSSNGANKRQGTAGCRLAPAVVPLPIQHSHPMDLGEVTAAKDSHSSLLAKQFFLAQKLLQGKTLKRHFSSEPAFPHMLLHHSLLLTLCHYKLLQVCAAYIH